MKSISTRRGDAGETDLLYGGRVSKADPRVDAYGKGDEVVSHLGLARAHSDDDELNRRLLAMQQAMFMLGAELATDPASKQTLESHFSTIGAADIEALDRLVEDLEGRVTLAPQFVLPGASIVSAQLDVARATLRSMERLVVPLKPSNPSIVPYMNRLSDALFLLARHHDRDLPQEYFRSVRKQQ